MIIRKYKIIHDITKIGLQAQVNAHIEAGWQPIGGICVATMGSQGVEYFQSVVHESPTGSWKLHEASNS